MATPRKSGDEQRTVTRTYRAAIRMGEDFITLEETVTLPVEATDEDVRQAVDLGLRIYQAQREAVEAQIAGIRETAGAPAPITVRDPDAPASDKQRNFIGTLQDTLGWTNEQLASYANEHSVDLVTLNKGQASTFIDGLKKLSEERSTYSDGASRQRNDGTPRAAEQAAARRAEAPQASAAPLANERQLHAIERLAQQHGMSSDDAAQNLFGVPAAQLTAEQAGALLKELQRPVQRRAVNESAL